MKKISPLLLLLLCFFSTQTFALVRSDAESELALKQVQADKASEVQVNNSSMLQMKDPFVDVKARDWLWQTSIQVQNYQPEGQASVLDQTENISETGSTVLPVLGLGAQVKMIEALSGIYSLGLEAQAGYITQERQLRTATTNLDDVHINTTLLQAQAQFRYSRGLDSKWNITLGAGAGQMTVTQTASNSIARWSKNRNFTLTSIFAGYDLSSHWALELGYINRLALGGSGQDIEIAKDNWILGTRILW